MQEDKFIEITDRLLARIKAKSDAFDSYLDSLPIVVECENHAGVDTTLNRDKSYKVEKAVYDCPSCQEEAFARWLKRKMVEAGIPHDVLHATLENFEIDRPDVKTGEWFKTPDYFLSAAHDLLEGKIRNVFFCGTPGIGKGHLAAAICREVLSTHDTVAWVECSRLFQAYHNAYKTDTTESVINRYANPTLLVLDELCLRDLPADGEEILFNILDRRHKTRAPTILLGNKPAKDTRAFLGSRISDRLRSGTLAYCYGEWPSLRGTEKDGSTFEF